MSGDEVPTEPDGELDCLIYDVEYAWGTNVWLHARELESGNQHPVMILLTGHEPYLYVEPESEALENAHVTGVEDGWESIDGDPMVRAYVNHPGKVPKVADLAESPMEHDVQFDRRSVIDTGAWGRCTLQVEEKRPGVYATKPEWVHQESRRVEAELDTVYLDIEGGNIFRVEDAPDPVYCVGIKDPANDERHLWSYCPNQDVSIDEVTIPWEDDTTVTVQHRHYTDEDEAGEPVDGERAMLRSVIAWLYERKAEAIGTYNGNGFDLPYLIHRARKLGIRDKEWGNHGKVDPDYTNIPGYQELDLYKVHLKATYGGLDDGDDSLENVARTFCGIEYDEPENHRQAWHDDPESLFRYNIMDVEATHAVDEVQSYGEIAAAAMFLSYTTSITRITKPSDVYDGLFIETAQERDTCLPRQYGGEDWESGGAYVFPPDPGLYDHAVSFDWSSLYPTTIVTGNISYETLVNPDEVTGDEDWVYEVPELGTEEAMVEGPIYFDTRKKGILPTIVDEVWDIKKEMGERLEEATDAAKKSAAILYDMSKILLNSAYGLANSSSARLGRIELGAAVTATGRFVNKLAGDVAENTGRGVVGGDTDSVKVVPNPTDEPRDLEALVSYAESRVREETEALGAVEPERYVLEWEHVYEPLLITPEKKHYAYRLVEEDGERIDPPKRKVIGLWMVRSDAAEVTRTVMGDVLDFLLMEGGDPIDAIDVVRYHANRVRRGEVPPEDIAPAQALSSDIMEYREQDPETGEWSWTYWGAKACYEANEYLDLGERERWRGGDRPYQLTLKEKPRDYDANQLPVRAGQEVPEGFEVDWEHHLELTAINKNKSIFAAFGLEERLERLTDETLDVGVDVGGRTSARGKDGAGEETAQDAPETSQLAVSDFM